MKPVRPKAFIAAMRRCSPHKWPGILTYDECRIVTLLDKLRIKEQMKAWKGQSESNEPRMTRKQAQRAAGKLPFRI